MLSFGRMSELRLSLGLPKYFLDDSKDVFFILNEMECTKNLQK